MHIYKIMKTVCLSVITAIALCLLIQLGEWTIENDKWVLFS